MKRKFWLPYWWEQWQQAYWQAVEQQLRQQEAVTQQQLLKNSDNRDRRSRRGRRLWCFGRHYLMDISNRWMGQCRDSWFLNSGFQQGVSGNQCDSGISWLHKRWWSGKYSDRRWTGSRPYHGRMERLVANWGAKDWWLTYPTSWTTQINQKFMNLYYPHVWTKRSYLWISALYDSTLYGDQQNSIWGSWRYAVCRRWEPYMDNRWFLQSNGRCLCSHRTDRRRCLL